MREESKRTLGGIPVRLDDDVQEIVMPKVLWYKLEEMLFVRSVHSVHSVTSEVAKHE